MSRNVTVRSKHARKPSPRVNTAKTMKSESGTVTATADQNRAKLQLWSKNADYKSISFWVPPNFVATPDECIAEVAQALTNFEAEVKNGTASPVDNNDNRL